MKKTLRILFVIYAVVLFIPQFAQAGIKDFQNKVYAENQLDHVMTIQIDQNIKTKNSQNVLDSIKDVMNEYHSSIFFTKKDYNHYHKYIYTNDNNYFDVLGIKEYQSVELLQYQYQLDIHPLDQIIENDSFNGEARIVSHQDNTKQIKESLEKVLDIDINTVSDDNSSIDSMPFVIMVIFAFTVLLLLIIIYDQYQKYKLFSIKKLHGYSHGDIWIDETSHILIDYSCILFPCYTILSLIMTQKFNSDVIHFILSGYQTIIISMVLIFVFSTFVILVFSRVKVIDYLKGKHISHTFLYFNQFILFLLITIGIFLSLSATNYVESILSRMNNTMQWETTKDYYIIPAIQQTEDGDTIAQSAWLKNTKKAFIELNRHEAIYADFNDFINDGSIEEGYYYQGAVAYVNNEYLKVNKIVDSHGNLIQIDEKEERQVLLIPDNHMYDEKKLSDDVKNIGYQKNDDVIFVYYKSGQGFFSYNSKVINQHTNTLENIVLSVRTENNGDDIDYDRIMGYKGNPLKIKVSQKKELMSLLQKYGLEKYPVQMISAYDDMAELNHNEMMTAICMIATIGLILIFVGKAVEQGLYCFVHKNKKLIAVKRLHGFSLFKQYHQYFIFNVMMYVLIAGIFMGLQYHMGMVIFLIGLIVLFWIFIFMKTVIKSKKYYISSILKGE